jgi:hypothetical protein
MIIKCIWFHLFPATSTARFKREVTPNVHSTFALASFPYNFDVYRISNRLGATFSGQVDWQRASMYAVKPEKREHVFFILNE